MGTMPHQALARPPLRESALRRVLEFEHGLWRELRVIEETGSTNEDVLAAAAAGAPEGLVVVAERQRSGRGRHGRAWAAPARAALTFSGLLRPTDIPAARHGWLPLLAGVAVADAIRRVARLDARLKWPNDVLIGERKVAGILSEAANADLPGAAVVVGIGVNVSQQLHELPVPTATSLLLEGAAIDREPLLRAVLRELAVRYTSWRTSAGRPDVSAIDAAYAARSATLGRNVRVDLPAGGALEGTAVGLDEAGRLVVRAADVDHVLAAGDVIHVR